MAPMNSHEGQGDTQGAQAERKFFSLGSGPGRIVRVVLLFAALFGLVGAVAFVGNELVEEKGHLRFRARWPFVEYTSREEQRRAWEQADAVRPKPTPPLVRVEVELTMLDGLNVDTTQPSVHEMWAIDDTDAKVTAPRLLVQESSYQNFVLYAGNPRTVVWRAKVAIDLNNNDTNVMRVRRFGSKVVIALKSPRPSVVADTLVILDVTTGALLQRIPLAQTFDGMCADSESAVAVRYQTGEFARINYANGELTPLPPNSKLSPGCAAISGNGTKMFFKVPETARLHERWHFTTPEGGVAIAAQSATGESEDDVRLIGFDPKQAVSGKDIKINWQLAPWTGACERERFGHSASDGVAAVFYASAYSQKYSPVCMAARAIRDGSVRWQRSLRGVTMWLRSGKVRSTMEPDVSRVDADLMYVYVLRSSTVQVLDAKTGRSLSAFGKSSDYSQL
jgi:hypothetical protein